MIPIKDNYKYINVEWTQLPNHSEKIAQDRFIRC